jgi:hypothetical protein
LTGDRASIDHDERVAGASEFEASVVDDLGMKDLDP